MYKRLGTMIGILAMIMTLAVLVPSQPASAQDVTPVPTTTPTPSYQYEVPLTGGATMLVERRITYGEIGVIGTVLLLLVGSLVFWILRSMRLWLS